jgi:hypothetical protein
MTVRRYRTIQIQAGDHLITQPTRYPTTSREVAGSRRLPIFE